jgi:hypothetical protein
MTERKETYDLNAENYTETELVSLVKYKGDINNATSSDISSHINKMIVSATNLLNFFNRQIQSY